MGGTWSLGTATWSLGTTTWSLGTTTWSLVGTIIYMVAWTTIMVVDWFMVDASSHFDVSTKIQNFYPSLIPNDVFILVYSMQEGWACAIFFVAFTHIWGRFPFHQQVIFNHNFCMTTFTWLCINETLYLILFRPPVRALLRFASIKLFITQLLCFLSAVKIGASSARIYRCALPRAGFSEATRINCLSRDSRHTAHWGGKMNIQ